MNIQQALRYAGQKLSATSLSAGLDAQILLSHVLSCSTAHLAAWPEKNLNEETLAKFGSLLLQRVQGMPIAYLTGHREFWSLDLKVNNSTLIPRPETETLIEFVLAEFHDKKNLQLLDMGTGSGAIAIALATEMPGWNIYASELSPPALELARENSRHHRTDNIHFILSDWFTDIPCHNFDVIVSNPPYIAASDVHLTQGDVRFEPASALTAGATGMDDIEHLCLHAKRYLAEQGCLIVEHGYDQAQGVEQCFSDHDYMVIKQQKDLSGHVRLTSGRK